MRPNKQNPVEIELEFTTQQLLAPANDILEIDDIVAITTSGDSEPATKTESQTNYALDETSEIELTAEQMDAMLEGRWP